MRIKFILILLISSLVSYSQDTCIKILEDIEVVSIRASEITPITQKNIKKSEISENYTGQDMSYILQKSPSLTVYSDNGLYNSYTYFRLRGVDQTRINMTFNGIPLNEPEDQGAYFSNYPDFGSNVNSIQIQRGTGSTSYGTSSYIGSINFEGPNLLENKYTSLETGYGSYNTGRLSMAYNSGLNKKLATYVRYSNIQSDGYRYNSSSKSSTFFTSIGYYNKKDIFKLTTFSGLSNNGMAYLATNIEDIKKDPKINYLSKNERDLFNQSLISLQWIRTINKKTTLNSSLFYNNLGGNYDILFSDTIQTNNDLYKFGLKSNFYGLMSSINYTGYDKTKIQVGININLYDRTHMMSNYPNWASKLYSNRGNKNEFSTFIKLYKNISKRILAYGDVQFRSISFNYTPNKSTSSYSLHNSWSFINPKAGLRLIKNNKISHYISMGVCHREPTRNDIFNGYDDVTPISSTTFIGGIDTMNIVNIKPEQVIDIELGTEYKSRCLSIQSNVYYMGFKNEIAQIGQLSYIGLPLRKNVKSSFRSGIELDIDWNITKRILLSQNLNYSYNKIKEYTTEFNGTTYKNTSPLLTPNLITNTSITYKLKYISIGLKGRYVSTSYLDNTENDKFITPSFLILDSYLECTIKSLTLRLSINNITNQRYYTSGYVGYNGVSSTSSYYMGAPINYYITLNYKF